jgi:hypothetical protein
MNYVSEKNNPIKVNVPKIKRVIPLKEVATADYYCDMAELAVIFNHEIVEMENDVWRWKPNRFIDWIHDHAPVFMPSVASAYADGEHPGCNTKNVRASLCLNGLVMDLHRGVFTMEEWMKFYMQMGYSLSGYGEVFGQHEASEYKLPGAKVKAEGADEDSYAETIIDYMRRVYKGQTLKL